MGLVIAAANIALVACTASPAEESPSVWVKSPIGTTTVADLNNDGVVDLSIMTSDSMDPALYILDGTSDFDLGLPHPLLSFSKKIPTAIGSSIAVDSNLIMSVVVPNEGDGLPQPGLWGYETQGSLTGSATLPFSGTAKTSISVVDFRTAREIVIGSASGPFGTNPGIPELGQEFVQIPAPTGVPWDNVQLAFRYAHAGVDYLAIATDTSAFSTLLPADLNGPFEWSELRQGPVWSSQVVADLDADGEFEILGVEQSLGGTQVCALVVGTGKTACLQTQDIEPTANVALIDAKESGATNLILFQTGSTASVQLSRNVSIAGASLVATETTVSAIDLPPVEIHVFLIQHKAIVLARNGEDVCIQADSLQPCHP